MKAYEIGLGSGDTRMLLSPDLEFFQYFNSSGGQPAPGTKPGEHPTTPAEPKPTPEAATPPAAEPRAALEGSGAPETAATGESSGQSPPAQ